MKKHIKFFYIIEIILIFLLTEYFHNLMVLKNNLNYSIFNIYTVLSFGGYILLGFTMDTGYSNIRYKKITNFKINYIKVFLLILPFILLAIMPIEYIFIFNDLSNYPIILNNFEVFGIIVGYIISRELNVTYNKS